MPGGARGELRWPPVMARKRPEKEMKSIATFKKYCILMLVKQTFGILVLAHLAADTTECKFEKCSFSEYGWLSALHV